MPAELMISEMAATAAAHARQLQTPTAIPRMTIWCSSGLSDPTPSMFESKFYIVLQGRKRMHIGNETYDFAVGDYSVSVVGLPFMGEVVEASADAPYLALDLRLDTTILASLLFEVPERGERTLPVITTTGAAEDILEPLSRLVRLLARPADIAVLAPQFERELYYRLLQGPMADTLRRIIGKNTRFDQIRAAVEWIRGNADRPMHVAELAASVGMSVTSFHRHFKAVTAYSPLAYQRQVRLLAARQLLASDAINVTAAAFATGYASSSQFSREYKRMFGVPPIRDSLLLQQ